MKKLLVIAAAILSFSAVNAQVAYVGFQSVTGTSKTTSGSVTITDKNSNSGFFVGGAMNFEIADALGIQPALEFSYAGRKEKDVLNNDIKYSALGVRIPIDVNYGFEIADGFKVAAYAGPSIYFGISNQSKSDNVTVNYYENTYSRFGLGLGFGAWCDIQDMLRVKIGYDMGLLNRDTRDNKNYKESGLMISVGYIF